MTPGINRQAQVLLLKPAEDESVLQWAEAPDGPFGFHVQQAIEKLFKALLAQLSVEFPFSHDLNYLAARLSAEGEALPATLPDLSEIGAFAVTHRYDDVPEFQVLDRAAAVETVRLIREYVEARITALSGVGVRPPVQ
jgi:HEPN domain-containing protein